MTDGDGGGGHVVVAVAEANVVATVDNRVDQTMTHTVGLDVVASEGTCERDVQTADARATCVPLVRKEMVDAVHSKRARRVDWWRHAAVDYRDYYSAAVAVAVNPQRAPPSQGQ
jgi:hypothetical protein